MTNLQQIGDVFLRYSAHMVYRAYKKKLNIFIHISVPVMGTTLGWIPNKN